MCLSDKTHFNYECDLLIIHIQSDAPTLRDETIGAEDSKRFHRSATVYPAPPIQSG